MIVLTYFPENRPTRSGSKKSQPVEVVFACTEHGKTQILRKNRIFFSERISVLDLQHVQTRPDSSVFFSDFAKRCLGPDLSVIETLVLPEEGFASSDANA